MARKYWIVWNADRSEGFITDDRAAALNADQNTGEYVERTIGVSALGEAFSEYYREDDEAIHFAPEIEEVELPEIDAAAPVEG
jgi:hypothetical protein